MISPDELQRELQIEFKVYIVLAYDINVDREFNQISLVIVYVYSLIEYSAMYYIYIRNRVHVTVKFVSGRLVSYT